MPTEIIQPPETHKLIISKLLRWYGKHGRQLPWRESDDPYSILVSEVMLQQTQVIRVVDKYIQWMTCFPSLKHVARATKRDVLMAWSGLGYNRRALNFHACAKRIVTKHNGIVPNKIDTLMTLPGIGRYTAHAVACFAFRRRVPVVEVNIRRVFSRVYFKRTSPLDLLPEKEAWILAESLLPSRAYYNWHQALMDLGSTFCSATNPECNNCPVAQHCLSAGKIPPNETTRRKLTSTVPRRIYRGKILALLVAVQGHCMSFAALGKSLHCKFGGEHTVWLMDILLTLERDGMIDAFRNGRKIELEHQTSHSRISIKLVD